MQLPEALQRTIEKEIESRGLKSLIQAREELTCRYRQGFSKQSLMATENQRIAYIIARMPATYAAVFNVLTAIKEQAPDLKVRSLLDLGAGPGTVMWAASQCFPELESVTLLEKDASLVHLGKRLASESGYSCLARADWQMADLEQSDSFPAHDLVVFSYSIGELPKSAWPALIQAGWKAAAAVFTVIEPGTPAGFERIRLIRSQLIEIGGHLVAPCPHHEACPMADGDWCHFAARVERSSFHRLLKGGKLGYEDEKYSYAAATKKTYPLPQSRVLRHPLHRSGHVVLTLCTKEGLQRSTLSKRTPESYKQARKVEWGSAFPPEEKKISSP